MIYDVIILSYSKTDKHRKITEACIKSLKGAKNKISINIIVLESYDSSVRFKGVENVFYQQSGGFNYNNSMNEGFKYAKSDHVFFCNNDLIFNDRWADKCYHVFEMGYGSVSPYCEISHKRFKPSGDYLIQGYQVGFHVAGWCIGIKRKVFEDIGGFNEAVSFHYSDNLYAEQIKIEGVKHALVCNSLVTHLDLGSQTLKTLTQKEIRNLTSSQEKKYKREIRRIWDVKKKEVLRKRAKTGNV